MDDAEIISADLGELLEGLCIRHLQHLTDLQLQFESGEVSRYPSDAIKDSSNIITAVMKLLERQPAANPTADSFENVLQNLLEAVGDGSDNQE